MNNLVVYSMFGPAIKFSGFTTKLLKVKLLNYLEDY